MAPPDVDRGSELAPSTRRSIIDGPFLVGADWTESAQHALAWTADLAGRLDHPVALVHANSPWVGLEMSIPPFDHIEYKKAVTSAVRGWANSLDGVEHESRIVEDDADHAILEAASDLDPGLIVVGAHNGGGTRSHVLGSVTSKLLQTAETSVAVIPFSAPVVSAGPLVVGVDGSGSSERALRWAAWSSVSLHRDVYAVCVYPGDAYAEKPRLAGSSAHDEIGATASALRWLSTRVAAESGATVTSDVLIGHPGERLVASGEGSFAVVVGKSGHSPFGEIVFGSTTRDVAIHAQVPVIVVP
jgi:nucleotide-binding universal stress UspA family protein